MDPADAMKTTQLLSPPRREEDVPTLVRIPAGWFLMGCDSGQDNEKPVHRVWVDEFLLAARQVTNAEYEGHLRDTKTPPPPFWGDPAFNHPEQPVVGVSWHDAVRYCEWLSETVGKSGRGRKFRLPTEAEWERAAAARGTALSIRGAMSLRSRWRDTPSVAPVIGKQAPNLSPAPKRTHTVSTTCATMCTNGAATGTRRSIMRCRPSAIHAALKPARGAHLGEDHGVTTSRCRAVRPGPAFHQNSNTRTTDFALRAT